MVEVVVQNDRDFIFVLFMDSLNFVYSLFMTCKVSGNNVRYNKLSCAAYYQAR